MAKFCEECGFLLTPEMKLCPCCGTDAEAALPDIHRSSAVRKTKTEAGWDAKTPEQKVTAVLIRLTLWLLLLGALTVGILCAVSPFQKGGAGMGANETLILIFILLLGVAVLYGYLTRKKQREIEMLESEPDVEKVIFDPVPVAETNPKAVTHVTIYEHTRNAGIRSCPFCDAENGMTARKCCVCGREMK